MPGIAALPPWSPQNAFSEETGSAKFFSTSEKTSATVFMSLLRSSPAAARRTGPYTGAKTAAATTMLSAKIVFRMFMDVTGGQASQEEDVQGAEWVGWPKYSLPWDYH